MEEDISSRLWVKFLKEEKENIQMLCALDLDDWLPSDF